MNRFAPVFLFAFFLVSGIAASVTSYNCAEMRIVDDLNTALRRTLERKTEAWLTPDTIHDYRRNLSIPALRETAFLYYAGAKPAERLHSEVMEWAEQGTAVRYQSYASCSVATVLQLADLRLPSALLTLSLFFGIFSVGRISRKAHRRIALGGIVWDEALRTFYTDAHEPLHVTPLQERLLLMFFHADGHRLSKQTICDTLWPKKDNAAETLYTLIRRLKPVIESCSRLRIESERGKDYHLREES